MMLRELDAFEACWLDLKDIYPTSGQDNRLITHAMGQLVDLLEKPAQVEQDLPDHLKILFRRLALAYFQGYFPREARQNTAPADTSTTPPNPSCDRQQRREISAAVSQIKALAQKTQARLRQKHNSDAQTPASEMETLIIEFPDHWQSTTSP
ncbi:hypothetical protein IQ254_03820 [Nodosilinea sp. LEGE 07088]|uniref:hypothetical protein n=1 Tax=Nodosilinea sp. LEGE 07088 TaxID=2777968 RepID=UPI00187EC652|nr:hypothetical protein [Nodosilinea sp. LEGE 07088]MBE9136338.1 hypothetical protein [Nodosilinea sp. LEGE 07088]